MVEIPVPLMEEESRLEVPQPPVTFVLLAAHDDRLSVREEARFFGPPRPWAALQSRMRARPSSADMPMPSVFPRCSGTPYYDEYCNYLSVRVDFHPSLSLGAAIWVLQRARLYGHRPCYNTDGLRLLNVRPTLRKEDMICMQRYDGTRV